MDVETFEGFMAVVFISLLIFLICALVMTL